MGKAYKFLDVLRDLSVARKNMLVLYTYVLKLTQALKRLEGMAIV